MGGTANGESAAAIFAKEGILAFHWLFFFSFFMFLARWRALAGEGRTRLQWRYSGDIARNEVVCFVCGVATADGRENDDCVMHM
jgi:hypothetical protein